MNKIRKMTDNDREPVFNMMRTFYNSDALITTPSDGILERSISDCISDLPFVEGYIFEENEKIAGYAIIAKSYSTEFGGICIWIEDLYLLPEFRHKGIGTRFFGFLENEYKGKAVLMRLEAEHENENAVAAYVKNGFSELPYVEMIKKI